jgi:fucose permease
VATKTESTVVYLAGTVQGIALVTFPAASSIFTDPKGYDLSTAQYGNMFVPQVVAAITASLLGARAARHVRPKRLYVVGLAANLASMALLVLSQSFEGDGAAAYGLLLVATTFLGVGFGLTVPALNTLTAGFHPARIDTSVPTLNALLGLGTALAPVFVAIFVGLGFWWGLPAMSAGLIAVLLVVSLRLPLRTPSPDAGAVGAPTGGIPRRFWVFAAFAVLYGTGETMNGNWAQLDMTQQVGTSATVASIALTTFWAMVTLGRVLFAAIQRSFPTTRTYRLLPFVLAGAFGVIAVLPKGSSALGIVAFGVAGLGCSALLPLTISFGQEELVTFSASLAGGVIAFYQLGYGIAAFGAGALQTAGVSLPDIYAAAVGVALVMGALSFVVTRGAAFGAQASPTGAPSVAGETS